MPSDIRPLQFATYKGIGGKWGAAQFLLQEPYLVCKQCSKRIFFGAEADESHFTKKIKCECGGDLIGKEGSVFLSIAPTTAPNVYDWKNQKIVFALSVKDTSQVLAGIYAADRVEEIQFLYQLLNPKSDQKLDLKQPEIKLIHDPNAKHEGSGNVIKHFCMNFPKGISAGAMLNVSSKTGDKELKITVPLMPDELLALKLLLEAAIPLMLSWR